MKPHAEVPAFEGGEQAGAYDQAVFGQFMPGYHQPIAAVDGSRSADGILEVRHADGSGTAFYDHTVYQPPQGDYHVYADSKGGQWYAISGTASVDRRPVYENGAPIYDNGELRTYNVETVRYRTTPSKYGTPAVRPKSERKPPRRKQP